MSSRANRLPAAALRALRSDPRRAIGESRIVCLCCGRGFRQLTNTHLARHSLSAEAYKEAFGYNAGRALMCEALRRVHQAFGREVDAAPRLRRRPFLEDPGFAAAAARRAIRLEERLNRARAAAREGRKDDRTAPIRFLESL